MQYSIKAIQLFFLLCKCCCGFRILTSKFKLPQMFLKFNLKLVYLNIKIEQTVKLSKM